jgi:hypothetical protein
MVLLALTGCFDSLFDTLAPEPLFATGASFAFTSMGYRADTLLVGTIDVLTADSGRFTGTWDLHWSAGADSTQYLGLRSGHGAVDGTLGNGEASMDLVPTDSVGRLRLHAFADSLGWDGGWIYQRDSLFRRGGRFTARLLP